MTGKSKNRTNFEEEEIPYGSIFSKPNSLKKPIVKPAKGKVKATKLPASIVEEIKPDDTIASLQEDEVVLNKEQQRNLTDLVGPGVFKQIDVPGFATGGILNKKERISKLADEKRISLSEARKLYDTLSSDEKQKLSTKDKKNKEQQVSVSVETPQVSVNTPGGQSVSTSTNQQNVTTNNSANAPGGQSVTNFNDSSLRPAARIDSDLYTTHYSEEELKENVEESTKRYKEENLILKKIQNKIDEITEKQEKYKSKGKDITEREKETLKVLESEKEKRESILKKKQEKLKYDKDALQAEQSGSKYSNGIVKSKKRQSEISQDITASAQKELQILSKAGIHTIEEEKVVENEVLTYRELLKTKDVLEQQGNNLNDQQRQLLEDTKKQINLLEQEGIKDKEKIIESLRGQRQDAENLRKEYTKLEAEIQLLKKSEKSRVTDLQRSIRGMSELKAAVAELSSAFGSNSDITKAWKEQLDTTSNAMSYFSQDITQLGEEDQETFKRAMVTYKQYLAEQASLQSKFQLGEIDNETYFKSIEESSKKAGRALASISPIIGQLGKDSNEVFEKMKKGVDEIGNAAKETGSKIKLMNAAIDKAGSQIPLVKELSEAVKSLGKNATAAKLAFGALGAAAGIMVGKAFFGDLMKKFKVQNDITERNINTEADIAKLKFETDQLTEKGLKTNFLGRKKDNEIQKLQYETQFELAKIEKKQTDLRNKNSAQYQKLLEAINQEIEKGVAEFTAASKTAMFGKKLTDNLGYAKDTLVLAGMSAENVAANMKQAGVIMGQMPTAEVATTMGLIEKRTGASVDALAQLVNKFKLVDKLSDKSSLNMIAGFDALAASYNIPLDNLINSTADASKNMYSYGIKNVKALGEQVAAVQSLGASWDAVASAGKSMVMNYRDSIKAEMQLSSLLGEQVDLSEIRAQMAAGDYEGATRSLQSLGLNIEDMDQFQLEALSQSLGGMDVDNMTKLFKGEKIKSPAELKQEDAKLQAEAFAAALKGQKQELSISQAKIDAKFEAINLNLDTEIQKQILNAEFWKTHQQQLAKVDIAAKQLATDMENAFTATDAFTKQLKELSSLEVKRSWTDELPSILAGSIGAAVMLGVQSILSAVLPKFLSSFKGINSMVPPSSDSSNVPDLSDTSDSNTNKKRSRKEQKKQKKLQTKPKVETKVQPKKSGSTLKKAGKLGAVLTVGAVALNYLPEIGGFFKGLLGGEKEPEQNNVADESIAQNVASQYELDKQAIEDEYSESIAQDDEQLYFTGSTNDILRQINDNVMFICSWLGRVSNEQSDKTLKELQNLKAAYEKQYKEEKLRIDTEAGSFVDNTAELTKSIVQYQAINKGLVNPGLGLAKVAYKESPAAAKTLAKNVATNTIEKGKLVAKTASNIIKNPKEALQLAKASVQTASTGIKAASVVKMGANLIKMAGPQVIGMVAGMAGEHFGGKLEAEGMASADRTKVNQGKMLKIAGKIAEFATYGLMFGPITGAIGAALGGVYGTFQNYFSEDAKKQELALKKQEEVNYLISIVKEANESANKKLKEASTMISLSKNEETWRASMLAQTIEMTRLLGIISSGFIKRIGYGANKGKFQDSLGRLIESKDYNQTLGIQANAGLLEYKDDRQKNIANVLQKFQKNPGGEIKIGSLGKMNLQQYMQKFKVTQQELIEATEMARLMAINQSNQNLSYPTNPNSNITNEYNTGFPGKPPIPGKPLVNTDSTNVINLLENRLSVITGNIAKMVDRATKQIDELRFANKNITLVYNGVNESNKQLVNISKLLETTNSSWLKEQLIHIEGAMLKVLSVSEKILTSNTSIDTTIKVVSQTLTDILKNLQINDLWLQNKLNSIGTSIEKVALGNERIVAYNLIIATQASTIATNTTESKQKLSEILSILKNNDLWLQNKLTYMSGNIEKMLARLDKMITYDANISMYSSTISTYSSLMNQRLLEILGVLKNSNPWLQTKLTYMSGNLEKIIVRTDKLKDIANYTYQTNQSVMKLIDAITTKEYLTKNKISMFELNLTKGIDMDVQKKIVANDDKMVTYTAKMVEFDKSADKKMTELTANTKALVELTKAMEVISAAQYQYTTSGGKERSISLKVDGKTLAVAVDKFNANDKGNTSNARR